MLSKKYVRRSVPAVSSWFCRVGGRIVGELRFSWPLSREQKKYRLTSVSLCLSFDVLFGVTRRPSPKKFFASNETILLYYVYSYAIMLYSPCLCLYPPYSRLFLNMVKRKTLFGLSVFWRSKTTRQLFF